MSSSQLRIKLLASLFIIVALLLGVKLYLVQVVNGATYSLEADRQYARPSKDVFDRGSIFFTDKTGEYISAASLKTGYTVALNPSII